MSTQPREPLALDWPRLTLTVPPDHRWAGEVQLPGSKSLTNRMLLLAASHSAMTGQAITLLHPGDSDDSFVFRRFLRSLEVQVAESATAWTIIAPADLFTRNHGHIHVDMGLAGTALRFITAFACTLHGTFFLDGAPRLRERPVRALVDSLVAAGADVRALDQAGRLPLRIVGNPGWNPSEFTVDPATSSQLVTALLLLAPRVQVGTRILLAGSPSTESYVHMTLGLLAQLGWHWLPIPGGYELVRQIPSTQTTWAVEADWSAASYWLSWLALCPGTLTFPQLATQSWQGDAQQVQWLRRWGLEIADSAAGLIARHPAGGVVIRPLTADFTATPDIAQTYAVCCALVAGLSHFTGLHTLPAKETDRLAATVAELGAVGIAATATPDSLTIHGTDAALVQQRPIRTYHDHRMGMAFSLLAHRVPTLVMDDPGVVAKSYPHYWTHLAQFGLRVIRNG